MPERNVTLSVVSHGQNALVNQLLGDVRRVCADRVSLVLTSNVPDPFSPLLQSLAEPRHDGGRHFGEILDAIVAGRARPDPRVAAREHLAQFSHPALVERARKMIAALSELK